MPTLTDEEKVAAFAGTDTTKVEEPKEPETPSDNTEKSTSADIEADANTEAKVDDSKEEPLTKPYPWLKGTSPEEWVAELKTAYDNSTSQAIVLKKQLDDGQLTVTEAKKLIAKGQIETEPSAPAAPSAIDIDAKIAAHPAIVGAQSLLEQQMVSAFDDFSAKYPQAREATGLDQISKASSGIAQTFVAIHGRQPTYAELFQQTANLFGWQPAAESAKRDQSIKEVASGSAPTRPTSSSGKKVAITEAQLKVARRLFPTLSDEDLIKDLSKYV